MNLKITVLGCGNSSGVPAIGNYWGQCDPNEPKNRRTRSSLLVQSETTTLVIDSGPDFKQQINREDVKKVDAVMFSHAHSDHIAGIEDVRGLVFRSEHSTMAVYSNEETLTELKNRYTYLFEGGKAEIYPPIISGYAFDKNAYGQAQVIGDIEFIPFVQDHGTCETVGYRFGDFAYSVDILTLNETAIETLKGIKNWVVDCAGYHSDENPVHAGLKEIYRLNKEIDAETVYLTSMTLTMDYQTMISELPNGYIPAHDGLTFGALA